MWQRENLSQTLSVSCNEARRGSRLTLEEQRMSAKVRFTVELVVEPDDDGYHAFCPALKGLHVAGQTEEEAIQNNFEKARD